MLITISLLLFLCICYVFFLLYIKQKLQIDNVRLRTLLDTQENYHQDKIKELTFVQEHIENTLKNFSREALSENQKQFLSLAENNFKHYFDQSKVHMEHKEKQIHQLLDPISQTLSHLNTQLNTLEKDRLQTATKLTTQLSELQEIQKMLHDETSHLRNTFRNTGSRGQWGEIQLRRIVELTGMVSHCDFFEQNTKQNQTRPDMIIQLPEGKTIVIDAKVPMKAYLDVLECVDEREKVLKVKEHAKNVKAHIKGLSTKSYWSSLEQSPEFVVLFLPSDAFFSHALEGDPTLLEFGIGGKVIMATPTTLIALLKTVFFAWQNYRITDHAKQICEVGRLLYSKQTEFAENFQKVGKSLDSAFSQYQKTSDYMTKNIKPLQSKLETIMRGSVTYQESDTNEEQDKPALKAL